MCSEGTREREMQGDEHLEPELKTLSLGEGLSPRTRTLSQPLHLDLPAPFTEAQLQGVAMGTPRPHLSPGRRRRQPRGPRVLAASSSTETEAAAEALESVVAVEAASTPSTALASETSESVILPMMGPMTFWDYEVLSRQNILPIHNNTEWLLDRCTLAFGLAVSFEVVGLLVMLMGVFVKVFFYDLLLYAGAIVIFISLFWWVFWYTGNVEAPSDYILFPGKRLQLRSSSYFQSLRDSLSHRLNFCAPRRPRRTRRKSTLSTMPKTVDTSLSETPQTESLQSEDLQSERSWPEDLQPERSRPSDLQPERSRPEVLQPERSRPEVLQPERSRPEVLQPERSRPEVLQPERSRPEVLQPERSPPESPQPGSPQSESHLPESPQPETSQSESSPSKNRESVLITKLPMEMPQDSETFQL